VKTDLLDVTVASSDGRVVSTFLLVELIDSSDGIWSERETQYDSKDYWGRGRKRSAAYHW